jgi:hypothetical protein
VKTGLSGKGVMGPCPKPQMKIGPPSFWAGMRFGFLATVINLHLQRGLGFRFTVVIINLHKAEIYQQINT